MLCEKFWWVFAQQSNGSWYWTKKFNDVCQMVLVTCVILTRMWLKQIVTRRQLKCLHKHTINMQVVGTGTVQCLWIGLQVCTNILLESTSFSRMIAHVHLSVFTHLWKIENQFLGFTWPAQPLDVNIIKNMWKVIKLYVQKEFSAINSRQDPIKSALTTWSKVH